MKLGSIILDLNTGKRGPLVSENPTVPGVWAWIDKRRVYVRRWAPAHQWPRRAVWRKKGKA